MLETDRLLLREFTLDDVEAFFELCTNPEVIREAVDAVSPGGTVLVFTMAAPGQTWSADLNQLYFREIAVVPSYSCGPDDTREALAAIAGRRVAVADLVSHRFPIDAAADAFARARRAEGSMKVVITF